MSVFYLNITWFLGLSRM